MANAKTIEIILKAIGDFGDVKGNIDVIQKSLNQLKLNPQLKQNFSNIFADLQKQTAKYQDYLNSGFKTKGDVTGLEKTGNKINALLNQLQTNMNKIDPSVLKESFKIDTTQFEELNNKLKETQNTINQITSSDKFKGLTGQVDGVVSKLNTLSKSKAITQFQESFKTGKIEETKIALDKLIENANKFNDEGKKTEYLKYIVQLKTAFDDLSKIDGLQKANDDLKGFNSQLESLGTKQLKEFLNAFAQGKISVQNFVNAVRGYSGATAEAAKKTFDFGSEIDHFKNRAAYFLGLTNSINLFKRALRKALETVKELDAVMTETAVVTDFTVGDMWEKLPEYAAHAKALGSSIKDVYAATTLYYQQGLKTNEAMGVGVETMKMARIANLEAGDATQYMTAALRGFNMEVNELNAERVNDVYSELAAITAADTSQIATAMSKTASIASAANMEFETTAALLAQIIETTQEAPETAGTALKTIIARFSEVKKLREEGQMTGEDEEGEAIDVNKIQGALRAIGISMDDFFAGAEGLDSILLKLAEKWKDLDFETQRYIATTAAGSRQQSRFIAMMSDYERTMELATAANNSAGASQQQFDKTLDSMEAKLAKLTTAWQEFTMGLANNEILKGAVDALTFVLNAINKLIDALSGNNGIAKSIITLNLAIAAIGGMRKILNNLFGSKFFGVVKNAFKQIPIEASSAATQASNSIVDTITAGFKTLEINAANSGAVAGQAYGQSFNTGAAQYINNSANITPSTAQGATTSQPIQNTQPSKQIKDDEQTSKEIVKQQTGLQKAWNASSTSAFRLGGILTSLTGTGLNLAASSALAKDETSALGTGLKNAGSVASVAGSAISMLAPFLAAMGVAIGPVIAGVAGLTLVVGLLSAAIKNEYNNSLEGRLEATTKATERAKTAAEEANAEYQELLNAKSSYSDLQSALNELTRDTNEWKQALVEANQQVLQLLETYPELSQFINKESGRLTLDEQGWTWLETLLINQAQNTQRLYAVSQMKEMPLEKEIKMEELSEDVYSNLDWKSSFKGRTGIEIGKQAVQDIMPQVLEGFQKMPEKFYSIGEKTYEEFVQEYVAAQEKGDIKRREELNKIWNNSQYGSEKGRITSVDTVNKRINLEDGGAIGFGRNLDSLTIFDEDLMVLAEQTGFTAYELASMQQELSSYDSYLQIYGQKLQVYAENLLSYLDEKAQNSQYSQQVTTGLAKNSAGRVADKIDDKKTELLAKDKEGDRTNIQDLATILNQKGYSIVDTTGSDKTYQEIYEQLTGASAEGLSTEVLAGEIAKIMVSEDLAATVQELIGRIDNLATKDEAGASQIASLISGELGNLNALELDSLLNMKVEEQAALLGYEDVNKYAEAQGYEAKKVSDLSEEELIDYASSTAEGQNIIGEDGSVNQQALDKFLADWGEAYVTAESQMILQQNKDKKIAAQERQNAEGKINSLMGEGYTGKNDVLKTLDTSSLNKLAEQAARMGTEGAKKYISSFENLLATSNLGEGQKDMLSNYLSSVDWSDMNEAVAAMDYMSDLGLDTSTIQNFWKTAVSGANTYMTSMEEVLSLTESLQGKMKKVGDIEKALTEGTASYDDMMQLVNAGVDISQFQLTPDGWKATADQIKAATDQMKLYNAEQARAVAYQQREEFNKAQEIWNGSVEGSQIKQLTSTNEDGTLAAGTIESNYQAISIATSLGLQQQAEGETLDEFIARIQEAYNSYIDLLNNGEDLQIIADKQAAMAEAATYTTDENSARGGSDESVRMSMQNETTEAGLDPQEVTAYSDSLKETLGLEQQMADRIAIDNAKMNQGIKELADNWDAWGKVLNSENKGTLEYSTTLTNVRNTMKKLLNINKDLSEDFLTNEKNLKLMKKASEGNAEAIKTLRKEATKDIIVQMDLDPDATEQVTSAVNSILDSAEYDDLQIGASLETTSFYNALQGLLDAGAVTTDEMNTILEGIGFEPTVEMETVTVQSINSADQTAQVLGPNGEVRTVKLSNDMTVGGTIQVPRIGNSKFKGAPKATINPGNKPSGGGGGGGGGSKEKWENPYDEFYNVVEDINEELRTREKLERRYQALLDKTGTKASDLVKNAKDQINSLEKQKKLREGLLEGRTRQMSDIESEYSDLSKYAWYNEQDGTIEIDWEKINALDGSTNEKLTSRIEEYIKKLEEQQDLIEQEEDELEAIEETLREIRDQGKDEYFDFEEQIKDALIDQRQKEIDKLSAINDSINDTNSRLIDAMQSSIDKYRQDRENERTEEELSDKQRRLAYLQQDTSGANALEIMQLQEEIDQGMEDYTDQLIDQKINELQEQNDEAAEQREKQIAIAEAQLKKWEESGEIWNNVYELMGKGMDDDGIIPGSELQNLLKEAANFEGMSELQKMDWLENLENNVAQAIQWLMVGNSSKMLLSTGQIKENQKITFTTRDGQTVTGTVQSDGTIKTDTGEVYKDVYRSFDGKTFYTNEDYIAPEEKTEEEATPTETTPQKEIKVGGKINAKGAKIYGYIGGEGYTQYFKDDPIYKVLDEKSGYLKVRWHKQTSGVTGWFKKKDVKAYKQGGLADFTGPAWLDGTKSKPEYILNAEQTKSFFELVDVLGSLKSGTNQSSQITGDSIYDVDINVESIGSDYDVEKLATTIKRMINDDARYRNNNAINLQR